MVNGPDGFRFTTLLEISVILNFFLLIIDIALSISSLFLNVNKIKKVRNRKYRITLDVSDKLVSLLRRVYLTPHLESYERLKNTKKCSDT